MSDEAFAAAVAIATAPWRLDPPLLAGIVRVGLLYKAGQLRRTWKERLCVLTDRGELHCFRVPEGGSTAVHTGRADRGRINCRSSVIRYVDGAEAAQAADGQAHCFGIQPASGSRRFLLAAHTHAERDEWVAAIAQFGDGPDQRPGSAPNAKARELLFGQLSHRGKRPQQQQQVATAEAANGSPKSSADDADSAAAGTTAAEVRSTSPPLSARSAPPKSLVTLGVSQAEFDKFSGSEKLYRSLGAAANGGNRSPGRSARSQTVVVGGGGANGAAASAGAPPTAATPAATPIGDILAARDAAHLPLAHPSQSPSLGTLAGGGRVYWCGWMHKYGGSGAFASWQRRWFVLTAAGLLHYFTSPEALGAGQKLRGTIDANHALVRYAEEKEHGMPHALTLHPSVPPGARTYVLAADTLPQREEWVAALSHFGEGPAAPPPRAHGPLSDKARDVLFGGHKKPHHSHASHAHRGRHSVWHAPVNGAASDSSSSGGAVTGRAHSSSVACGPAPVKAHVSAALLDKLGTNQRTLDTFASNPKAFAKLGLFEEQAPRSQRGAQGATALSEQLQREREEEEKKAAASARGRNRAATTAVDGSGLSVGLGAGAGGSASPAEMELTSFERHNTTGNRVPPSAVLLSGWLAKRGAPGGLRSLGQARAVKLRFATLTHDSLLYYATGAEQTPKGCIDLALAGVSVGVPADTEDPFNPSSDAALAADYPAAFVVRPPPQQQQQQQASATATALQPQPSQRTFVLYAPSDAQRDRWIEAIHKVLDAQQADREARAAAPPPKLSPRRPPGK